jgi:hypothetical protein
MVQFILVDRHGKKQSVHTGKNFTLKLVDEGKVLRTFSSLGEFAEWADKKRVVVHPKW